jgi:tRNA pseudouridine55 synthase
MSTRNHLTTDYRLLTTRGGILNVDKPLGWTSHDVVGLVRRLTGQRQVGHAGTLDPLATGVLLVTVGAATRLSDYLMHGRKCYLARVRLGQRTTTDDAEGPVIEERPTDDVTVEGAKAALAPFLGTIEQIPPAYPAIKKDGVPAYKLARQGKAPEMASRTVRIDGLALIRLENGLLDLLVWCGSGTYIRALARDVGARLGCGAHLAALRRLSSGDFGVDTAVGVQEMRALAADGLLYTRLRPADEAVVSWLTVVLDGPATTAVLHGNPVPFRSATSDHQSVSEACLYARDGRMLALARYDARRDMWQPSKVFGAPSVPQAVTSSIGIG